MAGKTTRNGTKLTDHFRALFSKGKAKQTNDSMALSENVGVLINELKTGLFSKRKFQVRIFDRNVNAKTPDTIGIINKGATKGHAVAYPNGRNGSAQTISPQQFEEMIIKATENNKSYDDIVWEVCKKQTL